MAGGIVRVEVASCGPEQLARHARISPAFEVRSVLDVEGVGPFVLTEVVGQSVRKGRGPGTVPKRGSVRGGLSPSGSVMLTHYLTERALDVPYLKDYDAIDGNHPTQWAEHFDLASWALFAAHLHGTHVGGAVVARDTPGVDMLEGRRDLAVLWDIRVMPDSRGQGAGQALFRAVEAWANARGCVQIKIETQDVNLPACRFYLRQGCTLTAIDRLAYPDLPHEIQMIWRKDLAGAGAVP